MGQTASAAPISIDPSKPKIFISHSHQDKDTAAKVQSSLASQGFSVCSDRQIQTGTMWRDQVGTEIEQADVTVFLVSRASESSRYCEEEIDFAVHLGKRVFRVKLEEGIQERTAEHMIDCTGSSKKLHEGVQQLAEALQSVQKAGKDQHSTAPEQKATESEAPAATSAGEKPPGDE
eukprot:TRINITY_DN10040_c0_g1_i1.p1 TRINITY_DN10040_c0_g1~~TRINITY_DN10040_c0_g1_i1.p1  ORF type:complete len:176 (+),score=33.22 TRINITY_DN10040_c0_g1_i1:36-563(+)